MGLISVMRRGGSDVREYKKALKMAKEAIDIIAEISEEMEDEYSERDDYDEHAEKPWHNRVRRYR